MSIIKKAAIVAVVVGAAVSSTFLLPQKMVVTRHVVTQASPGTIIGLAASNSGYQTFNPYKDTDPALKIETFGPAAGVGSGFTFAGKDGTGKTTVTAQGSNRVDYRIDIDGMGSPTQSIVATPIGEGTKIEWTMAMDLGNNPVMRVMGLVMPSMMGPTLDAGLINLTNAASKA
jgi:hypothetical protein